MQYSHIMLSEKSENPSILQTQQFIHSEYMYIRFPPNLRGCTDEHLNSMQTLKPCCNQITTDIEPISFLPISYKHRDLKHYPMIKNLPDSSIILASQAVSVMFLPRFSFQLTSKISPSFISSVHTSFLSTTLNCSSLSQYTRQNIAQLLWERDWNTLG